MTSLLALVVATAVFVIHAPANGMSKSINLRLSIDEERPKGTVIANMMNIFGLSPNKKKKQHFKLLEQKLRSNTGLEQLRHGLVTVDQETGIIKLHRKVDRDQLCAAAEECLLDVQAVMLPQQFFSLLTLEILINDVNDNAPIFPTNPIAVNISESANIGNRIILNEYQARDIDAGNNSVIQYVLSYNQFFKVEHFFDEAGQSRLELVLLKKLDYEAKTVHHVKLIAKDLGNPSKSNHVTVRIQLIDSNDNPPVFERREYIASLRENLPPGTEVAAVQAHDLDSGRNSKLTYHLVADPQSSEGSVGLQLLSIDPTTGAISLREKLDREIHDGLQVQIEARDKGSPQLSSRSWVILQVEDINDNLPIIKQNFIVHSYLNTAFLEEGCLNGTYVAYVSASDADNGPNGDVSLAIRTVPYGNEELDNEDSGHFVLASDGLIGTGRQFDREMQNRYKIILSACDDGQPPRCAISNISVVILDKNDNYPRFAQPVYDITMSESDEVGSYVFTALATDDDHLNEPVMKLSEKELVVRSSNGDVRYAIAEEATPFSIDAKTGRITLIRPLDREGRAEWKVPLLAIDGGKPEPKTGSSLLRVTVHDINDNPPLFVNPTFDNMTIFASILRSDVITQIQTIDYDSKLFSEVNLKLVSIDGKNMDGDHTQDPSSLFFILDPKTGDLRLNMSYMDLEEIVGVHHITIEAKDSGSPALSNKIGIFIYVTDSLILPTTSHEKIQDSTSSASFPIQTLIISLASFLVFLIIVIIIVAIKRKTDKKRIRTYNCRAAEKGCGTNPNLAETSKPAQGHSMWSEPPRNNDVTSHVIISNQPERDSNNASVNGDVIKRKSATLSRGGSTSNHAPLDGASLYKVLTSVDRVPPSLSTLSCDDTLRMMSQSNVVDSLLRPPTHLDIDSGKGESEVDTTSFGGTASREYERLLRNTVSTQQVQLQSASSDHEALSNMGRYCTEECRYYGHSDPCWMPSNDHLRPSLNISRRGLETISERSPPYLRRNDGLHYQEDVIRARVKRNMFLSLGEPMAHPHRVEMENYHSEDLTQQCQYWPEDNGTPLSSVFSSTNPSPTPSNAQCATTYIPLKLKKSVGDRDVTTEQQQIIPKENYLSVSCNRNENL